MKTKMLTLKHGTNQKYVTTLGFWVLAAVTHSLLGPNII